MQDSRREKKRYFRSQVTDGTKKMCIVVFDENQLKQVETLDANKISVKPHDCEVQWSSYSGDLEIKLTGKITTAQSPKKLLQI